MSMHIPTTDSPAPVAALASDWHTDHLPELERLATVFVPHKGTKDVMANLDILLKYGKLGASSKRASRCFLLTGVPGSGKSSLIRKWATERGLSEQQDENGHRGLLYVEATSNCSPKSLAQEMLHKLGDPNATKGTEVSCIKRALGLIEKQMVKIIVVDEFQELLNRDNQRVIVKAADFIKRLLNAALCPVVLAGLPDAKVVYDAIATVQLKRRSFGRCELKPFNWANKDERTTFRGVLHTYEKALPFNQPSKLRDLRRAGRIYAMCEGVLGRGVDFLTLASAIALEEGEDCLTDERLRLTAELFAEDADWVNPFSEYCPPLEAATESADEEEQSGVGADEATTRNGKTQCYKAPRAPKPSDVLAV